MLLESAALGAEIDLAQIPRPAEVELEPWLCAFPSFGFLLAVEAEQVTAVQQRFHACDIACAAVGHFTTSQQLMMQLQQQRACYWDLTQQPLTGMTNH